VSMKEPAALKSATQEIIVNGLDAVARSDSRRAGPKVVVFREFVASRLVSVALRWPMIVRIPIQLMINAPMMLITRWVEWAERRTAAPSAPKTQ
jgi:hypothetical protein